MCLCWVIKKMFFLLWVMVQKICKPQAYRTKDIHLVPRFCFFSAKHFCARVQPCLQKSFFPGWSTAGCSSPAPLLCHPLSSTFPSLHPLPTCSFQAIWITLQFPQYDPLGCDTFLSRPTQRYDLSIIKPLDLSLISAPLRWRRRGAGSMRAKGKHLDRRRERQRFPGVLPQRLEISFAKWLAEFCMENRNVL